MGEAGGIEIEPSAVGFCPGDPVFEMFKGDFVAVDFLSAELTVEGVKIQPMFAGNERESFIQVGAKFVRSACFTGIVAGGDETAAERGVRVFKTADVIALPAVQ